ncbi:MAG: lysophospholipid acyltransferase family protein [Solirubrobacterales bacterium]|jgi:lauroyl/myristoyl acyltransferase
MGSNADASPGGHPHAPALGRTQRLFGRFHVTGVFWYQFPHWAFTHLPSWVEWPAVVLFTTFFFMALGRIRGAIASNLEPVLGRAGLGERWLRSFRTMYSFAWCLTERYRRFAAPERFRSTLEGEEHWQRAMAGGTGVVLVTAHIGPWEAAVEFGAAQARRRLHVVREEEIDPRAQTFMRDLLARAGAVTHFAAKDPRIALELAQALGRGDVVALQGDRPRAGGRSVTVSLFGRPMPMPVGPAALARAARVPLLPVFNFREGRCRLRAVVRPPVHVARTADRNADVADAVRRLAVEIEWAIRERPYQWFCFRTLREPGP